MISFTNHVQSIFYIRVLWPPTSFCLKQQYKDRRIQLTHGFLPTWLFPGCALKKTRRCKVPVLHPSTGSRDVSKTKNTVMVHLLSSWRSFQQQTIWLYWTGWTCWWLNMEEPLPVSGSRLAAIQDLSQHHLGSFIAALVVRVVPLKVI